MGDIMIKAQTLKKGDKVAIVSLSSGILGEAFCSHYIQIGQKRLSELGLETVFMPNTLKGFDYIKAHPEKRAQDLKAAFMDDDIKGIICAIGGDDTFRTIEFLMDDEEFKKAVKNSPKIFTGFSDTTVNHFMFYRLGLVTYYGPNYINDLSEMADNMLLYTKDAFRNYYLGHDIYSAITSSDTWYEERTDFSPNSIGVNRVEHIEKRGYELIQGSCPFEGELLGGCIESLYDMISVNRYEEEVKIIEKYNIFPSEEEWEGKVLFIETSEEAPSEQTYKRYLQALKSKGIFDKVNGIICGKPQNETHYEAYKRALVEVVDNPNLPILYNINFGHAYPRTVFAYGVKVRVTPEAIEYLEDCIVK